jgi:hypothetical protein
MATVIPHQRNIEIKKSIRGSLVDLELEIFVKKFEFYLVTQAL